MHFDSDEFKASIHSGRSLYGSLKVQQNGHPHPGSTDSEQGFVQDPRNHRRNTPLVKSPTGLFFWVHCRDRPILQVQLYKNVSWNYLQTRSPTSNRSHQALNAWISPVLKVKVKGLQSACAIAPFQVISAKKARSDVASLKGMPSLKPWRFGLKILSFYRGCHI